MSLLRGCTASTPPFHHLLGQLLIKGRFSFWPRFCCRWNLWRILFSSLHLSSACTLSLLLLHSWIFSRVWLFLCVSSSLRLWHAVFAFYPPWSFPVTRSAILLWPHEPAWKDTSFVIATIVMCYPSPYKTSATHPRLQDVRLSLRCFPGAEKGQVIHTVTRGPRIDLRQCRAVEEVWGSRTWEFFLCAMLSG